MSMKDNSSLAQQIDKALKKIGAKRESDICRYLPGPNGGYMHHFTFRKMKREEPEDLQKMISEFLLESKKIRRVAHKPRAARGSRKRRDQILFSRQDIDMLLRMARLAGNKEMIRKLTPKQDFKTIKKELLSSIRQDRPDLDLWNSLVEILSSQKMLSEA